MAIASVHQSRTPAERAEPVRIGFARHLLLVFGILAALSLVIHIGGRMIGQSISAGGHTPDTTVHEVVIGNNVLAVNANMIRFENQRRSGVQTRTDLYLLYPGMTGYTDADRDAFNMVGGESRLVFLSFEERQMSRDMTGRLEPIYRNLVEENGTDIGSGLMAHMFRSESGYMTEFLAVGPVETTGEERFVARCLADHTSETAIMACERDIHVGDDLSLIYRFPRQMLSDWRLLDANVRAFAARAIRTAG